MSKITNNKPYAIDLFCGAGGGSEGLIQAGFHILFSSDISEMVEKTYVHRHEQLGLIQGENTWFERSDIKDLTGDIIKNRIKSLKIFDNNIFPEIDLMIGGPSCQGFSRAGRRDKSDPRNMLFGEYVRVISEIRPKYIILENVEGFMDMQFIDYKGITGIKYPDGSVTPTILTSELHEIGYETLKPRILNAADYGVPQRRNRVIFIGYKKGLTPPQYPTPTTKPENYISLQEAIGDLITDEKNKNKFNKNISQYQKESNEGRTPKLDGNTIKADEIKNTELPKQAELIKERYSLFKEGETSLSIRNRITSEGIDISGKTELINLCTSNFGMNDEQVIKLFKKGNPSKDQVDILLTKKSMRRRLSSNQPSATIVTIPDDYINPWENRTLSVREMARCQSFDDSFEFLGKRTTGGLRRRIEVPQCTQVGNAIPPLLAKALAEEIIKVL